MSYSLLPPSLHKLILYVLLLVLVLRNIWVILYKQQEYKNLPIPIFYGFALIAITLRLIDIIWGWTPSSVIQNVDWIEEAAKLCVGMV